MRQGHYVLVIIFNSMYTIAGLGNPGAEYEGTRHNVGRQVLLDLAEKFRFGAFKTDKKSNSEVLNAEMESEKVRLILPNTFMNKSGQSISYFIKSEKTAKNLVVIHDDLDLPLGMMRIVQGRGSGGHKGVESIMRAIKTKDFIRIRIGISKNSKGKAKKPNGEMAVNDFVLGNFSKVETEIWTDVRKKAIKCVTKIVEEGVVEAMNEFNRN
jgi:peptidyl-tRNA hydrolase, PTH1 family